MNIRYPVAVLAAALLALCGCSKSSNQSSSPADKASEASGTVATPAGSNAEPMEADLARTLKEQSDFYVFKQAADWDKDTKGLKWEDGTDLPVFADVNAKKGGTINEWLPDFPATLRTTGPDANDPFREYLLDYVELQFLYPHPNLPGKYYPELASRYAADFPNKTVYITIDPDARWSDGVPVTTDDVVFSWYFYRSKFITEPWNNDYYTKNYTKITVYDKYNFSLTVPEAKPDMVDKAADVSLYPRHAFKDFGPGWLQRHDWYVTPTTGAYTVLPENIKKQVSITLTHVPNWWAANKRFMKGRFNPDKVRCVVVHDPVKAFEEFLKGDIDIFPISKPQLWYDKTADTVPAVANGWVVKSTFYNVIPCPSFGLWINQSKPILSNRDVRVGIQYASNVDLVCRKFFRGDAVQQQTASDGYGWDINPKVRPRPFDPEKARESFAKAGFTQQGPDGVLVNDKGERLSFLITNAYAPYTDVLTILKSEALKAGLELNIETPDQTTAFQKISQKTDEISMVALNRTVEAYPRYWECFSGENAYDKPYLPDGSVNPNRKIKPDTNNYFSLANPELDALIKQYDKASTMDEVKSLAAKIEMIIWQEACWVPGWKLPFIRTGYRPWIKWPADFAPMRSLDYLENWTMWVDTDEQARDIAAHEAGQPLPKQTIMYDRYKQP